MFLIHLLLFSFHERRRFTSYGGTDLLPRQAKSKKEKRVFSFRETQIYFSWSNEFASARGIVMPLGEEKKCILFLPREGSGLPLVESRICLPERREGKKKVFFPST